MTSEADTKVNYYTHGTGAATRPHEFRYLGRAAQGYQCMVCQLKVSKSDLKANTDVP